LVIVLAVLALLGSVLAKYLQKDNTKLSEEDEEVLGQKVKWGSVFQSSAFIGIVSFVFLALVLKAATEGMLGIGVQQGYAPTQPIPFSHKLHAGQYEIDCKYCHTGVEKGKSANIPSANICMNCHNAIKTTSPNMQMIYAAIEKDEPIQWVRVHNLPDLAYFNHQQHVKVAGLACENCHGEIKEMEVVQQASLLTMGWCIDCHRKTDVNAKGNAYYDNLVELHNKSSKEPMKVEDIGGLECSKCHY
jgi:Cytochrome c7 and related cytochrome c/Class III cytochrome C family